MKNKIGVVLVVACFILAGCLDTIEVMENSGFENELVLSMDDICDRADPYGFYYWDPGYIPSSWEIVHDELVKISIIDVPFNTGFDSEIEPGILFKCRENDYSTYTIRWNN